MQILRFLFAASIFVAAIFAPPLAAARGTVAVIGGALRADNSEVWKALIAAAGGADAQWVVIPTASETPEKSARDVEEALKRHGARGRIVAIPLSTRWPGQDVTGVAHDALWVATVAQSRGVYFTGGSQERITAALLEPDGSDTPLLAAIRALLNRGGVIAGSSAGAAVMAQTMIRDIPDLIAVLQRGLKNNQEISRGLGFAGEGVLTDQHFIKRGRIGRLLPAMHATGVTLGVGVEENTAALLRAETLEVFGPGGVIVADLKTANVLSVAPFHVQGVILHVLDRGDRFDFGRRIVLVQESKQARRLDATANDFKPYYTHVPFYPDLLADRAIVNAATTLLDSPAHEARGLAFRAMSSKDKAASRIGFEFRLFKREGTLGYAPSSAAGQDYTVSAMGLDIVPVEMADPLYRRLHKTEAAP